MPSSALPKRDKSTFVAWVLSFFESHPTYQMTDPTKQYVILTLHGSFNPLHKGHLGLLKAAKKELLEIPVFDDTLEQLRHRIIIGYVLCPRDQEDLQDKFFNKPDEEILSTEHRYLLCHLATEHLPNYFLLPSTVERGSHGGRSLQICYPELSFIEFYSVWGEDFFNDSKHTRAWRYIAANSIIVPRKGLPAPSRDRCNTHATAPFLTVSPENADSLPACSSTLIRKALRALATEPAPKEVSHHHAILHQLPRPIRAHLKQHPTFFEKGVFPTNFPENDELTDYDSEQEVPALQ